MLPFLPLYIPLNVQGNSNSAGLTWPHPWSGSRSVCHMQAPPFLLFFLGKPLHFFPSLPRQDPPLQSSSLP